MTEERKRGGEQTDIDVGKDDSVQDKNSNDRHEDNSTERLQLRTLVTAVYAILREKRDNK